MSKCREAFEKLYSKPLLKFCSVSQPYVDPEVERAWRYHKHAWNARGKVDAEIARTPVAGEQDDITMEAKDRVAEAIEKENEK